MNSPLGLVGVILVVLIWVVLRRRAERTSPGPALQSDPLWTGRIPEHLSLPSTVEESLRERLSRRKKIAAIKLVREHTGWDLRRAKHYVEWRLDPRRPPPDLAPSAALSTPDAADLDAEVRRLLVTKGRNGAVKYVVVRTGWSLKEAVSYVRGFESSRRPGDS